MMKVAMGRPGSGFEGIYAPVRERVEFGDAFIFLYGLVFINQYFWFLGNNTLAWAISFLLALVCSYFYVSTKSFPRNTLHISFWLVVGLPLAAAYILRAAFPDQSFDVVAYHLTHAERSLVGPLFAPGDFFPSGVSYNPVADTVTGISRRILGYRLGTAINLLVLVWSAQIADKILRSFIVGAWLRSFCVLFAVLAEHLLFEINTYMVDLLAIPLLLEATFLTLHIDAVRYRRANFVRIALLLGASVAFKFSNLTVVLPLIMVCAYHALVGPGRSALKELPKTLLLTLLAFLASLLPFSVYIWRVTGNPFFPIANVFFQSPYWPTHGGWDNRWGPHTFFETILWPLLIWFKPERHSELTLYSGRLSLGFLVAVVGLPIAWRNTRARTLCLIFIASSLLWSVAGLGYSRYGLYQELLAGVTITVLCSLLLKRTSNAPFAWKTSLAFVLVVVLGAQSILAWSYLLKKDWGSRSNLIADPGLYAREMRYVLRDRSLRSFLSPDQRAIFDNVPAWLETCSPSSGYEMLLNARVPAIAARQPEYFFTRESRKRFIEAVERLPSRQMFSLCIVHDVQTARDSIELRGLEIARMTPMEIPFFSPNNLVGIMLFEVLRPEEPEALTRFQSSWMNAAFSDADYREEITALDAPTVMRTGEKRIIRCKVKNLGLEVWPSRGNKDGWFQVNLGNRWFDAAGKVEITGIDSRGAMPADLGPGAEVEVPITVKAPTTPGDYIIEFDMVHEAVTWFYERGSHPTRLRIRVE
jgi:hypothetical protein